LYVGENCERVARAFLRRGVACAAHNGNVQAAPNWRWSRCGHRGSPVRLESLVE